MTHPAAARAPHIATLHDDGWHIDCFHPAVPADPTTWKYGWVGEYARPTAANPHHGTWAEADRIAKAWLDGMCAIDNYKVNLTADDYAVALGAWMRTMCRVPFTPYRLPSGAWVAYDGQELIAIRHFCSVPKILDLDTFPDAIEQHITTIALVPGDRPVTPVVIEYAGNYFTVAQSAVVTSTFQIGPDMLVRFVSENSRSYDIAVTMTELDHNAIAAVHSLEETGTPVMIALAETHIKFLDRARSSTVVINGLVTLHDTGST